MINAFRRQTQLAAALVRSHLKMGDSAIDATAGNGVDTLMMAECVGETGHVYAFDIQQEAIKTTEKLLSENGCSDRVTLICSGHETISNHQMICDDPRIKAAMFNLGYRPGGNKAIVTSRSTTLKALEDVLTLLQKDGIITICAYSHPEGLKEIYGIETWAADKGNLIDVHRIETINHIHSPKLYLIIKK